MAARETATSRLAADPMAPRFAKVRRVIRETNDTVTMQLSDPSRTEHFAPGQFNMLYLFGVGEVAISISGDPGAPRVLTHTIRAVGTVTEPLTALKRGAEVGVRGPFGSSWPLDRAQGRDLLLMAGGIGLAPLRPVIYEVLRRRGEFGRLTLLYGARTPADLLYVKELEIWHARPGVTVRVIVDRGDPSWSGPVGVLTDLLAGVRVDSAATVAMICGPEVMMRFAQRELHKLKMPDDNIYLSLERNMRCAVGTCGHCLYGPVFICKEGPVFCFSRVASFFGIREL